MSKIYMHQGSSQFNPEKLRTSASSGIMRYGDKPAYGLWASPFNDPNVTTWENWATGNLYWSEIETQKLRDRDDAALLKLLHQYGVPDKTSFYNMRNPREQMMFDAIHTAWSKIPRQYSDEEMKIAECKDRLATTRMAADKRNNTFFFHLEKANLLHINSLNDIQQFLDNPNQFRMWDGKIRFDKIKDAGYDGIALHNPMSYSFTILSTWDVDSVVVWNPDCVEPIPKEIAYMSRMANVDPSEIDKLDAMMDPDYLIEWMLENQDIVEQAREDGLLSFREITAVVGKRYDVSEYTDRKKQECDQIDDRERK